MMPCALVVRLANHPLNGGGAPTVRREPEHLKPGMVGQPLGNGFGFVNTVVIHDHIDMRHAWRGIHGVQQG